jgi:hypothetical protein
MMAHMARSRHNSPLVRIAWADAVSGNRRSSFDPMLPLELRIGLVFEPSFWQSFESAWYHIQFTTFRFGYVAQWFHLLGDPTDLAGAPGSQLWVGVELGVARQTNIYDGEPVNWEASASFRRWGGAGDGVTQWAVTPDRSAFFVENQSTAPFPGSERQRQTGGPGTPANTPPHTTFS